MKRHRRMRGERGDVLVLTLPAGRSADQIRAQIQAVRREGVRVIAVAEELRPQILRRRT